MTMINTKEDLRQQGWPDALLSIFNEAIEEGIDLTVGEPFFNRFWANSQWFMSPKERLEAFLNVIRMPSDLVGEARENKQLVQKISLDLAPDDPFWYEFAALVAKAFPESSLAQAGDLERRLHQFRYIISSHQAQFVREHFKKRGMTDRDALALYLKDKKRETLFCKGDYTLSESSRLHNKIAIQKGQIAYPDQEPSANIKVLMGFHTEFILDSKGCFLNENDAEVVTENGIVNGASFNYGTKGKRHWQLDVDPVRRHDPMFRKQITRAFRAPNRRRNWLFKVKEDYDRSYFNAKGKYSVDQLSRQQLVSKEVKRFKKEIRQA
ncbi:DUF3114 domain-containing protein [Streptococcus halotolerans]|uniref:DUF3114 domain-containing protein n=1 Tax=Streptococcus halotolerans TaxID=1814128 RepID=UPI000AF97996|nr:DUF3114 domain-containing protein [Streptococcus halotolerans]